MSTMAMSALNPDAPMFIPAAFKKVEDYSPEWWELVKTTAWFRDHWFRQHQLYEDLADDVDVDDVAALLPDDSVDLLDADDLFYSPPSPQPQPDFYHYKPAGFGGDMDAVLKTLSVNSPRGGGPAPAWAPMRHAEKPAQHVGPRAGGGARRAIHQPR
ncbi:hypothetical protein CFC21_015620 [Triticum aestivum]|uniref:Protein EARLY RESPONSIVE TO DEHYDRATION 15 n=3 Tax=Triticum TaxID=4564 RepID=A0A8R7PAV7_TRIUA|nr:protein EARLY RESPONSIVE TO DEHYDRATION 15-like [Triticum dicoccoides]XP_044455482.1 protein EARLY RESPONSIVE TO DEHYDRATION 15-like [Triticum aestivum]XP_048554872.1 protein EARLY RESPONSIVE TO DEHYDRATION 15-like [Triticum urartu]KAF6999618.1 hypothetical protein CFC21_015620 [Triticum aestivum]